MKQYIYRADECGFSEWPSGTLRLDGIELTQSPHEADVFVCPGNLSLFQEHGVINQQRIYRLPYLRGNEQRHCFLDVSDNFEQPIGMPCLFIKCDTRSWMLPHDPNSIQMAWPVEDFSECIPIPPGGFIYDISFHGWLSTTTRELSSQSCIDTRLRCDMARYTDFTGYIYYEPEGIRRRAAYRHSLNYSRLALCPESIPGVMPYRFYEAMSAGRVPVLVSSDFVLPFDDEIPYHEFIVQIPRHLAAETGGIIANYLGGVSDGQLIEMGKQARKYWEKYLDSRKWPQIMAYAVQKQMARMGLTEDVPTLCA